MSARIGNPQQTNFPVTALGSPAGVVIPINNSGWALLISALITYRSTATIGNRQIVIDIDDALGNTIWTIKVGVYLIAGQSAFFALACGVQRDSTTELRTLQQITQSGVTSLVPDELDAIRTDVDTNPLPNIQTIPLPEGFSIPVNAIIEVFDSNAVDSADTVQATLVFTL
jgi:hypothetical protein